MPRVETEPLLILLAIFGLTGAFFALSAALQRQDRGAWLAARQSELDWEAHQPANATEAEQREAALAQAREAREWAEARMRLRLAHVPHQVVAGVLRLGLPEELSRASAGPQAETPEGADEPIGPELDAELESEPEVNVESKGYGSQGRSGSAKPPM